jgi:hypothetical protein
MLIRPEQMAAFSTALVDAFETAMVNHLSRCFPAECRVLGEAGLHETIRYGIERARVYEITSCREVCTYIDLMIVFGPDFDQDPELPWAASILNGNRWNDTATMLDQLYRAAQENYSARWSSPL